MNWSALSRKVGPALSDQEINRDWMEAVKKIGGAKRRIIVLDDDPTGTQTAHSVPVYTSWDYDTLQRIMNDEAKLIYILTNSRALTAEQTEELHRDLARNLSRAAKKTAMDFILVSRSDSTLRGHYPLETEVLYQELKRAKEDNNEIDGEIIIPFFKEGGRFTYHDTHYVKEGETLVRAGDTEFAQDPTFGYRSSDLKEWIEEKTGGQYPASKVKSVSLELLREKNVKRVTAILLSLRNFDKVIVNAIDDNDLKVFVIALADSLKRGKRFIFRTAASFLRAVGGIKPAPLLTQTKLYPKGRPESPGMVIAGSFVQKTTRQLEKLRELPEMEWIEWEVKQAETLETFENEVNRVINKVERAFKDGKDVCVYTSRNYYRSDSEKRNSEENLVFSTLVSDGLVRVVKGLTIRPGYLVAKGGITSSDIGVRGLKIKRAMVMGQISPGIPVWELGPESRFPGLPYVIFPGNVGNDETLKEVVSVLKGL